MSVPYDPGAITALGAGGHQLASQQLPDAWLTLSRTVHQRFANEFFSRVLDANPNSCIKVLAIAPAQPLKWFGGDGNPFPKYCCLKGHMIDCLGRREDIAVPVLRKTCYEETVESTILHSLRRGARFVRGN